MNNALTSEERLLAIVSHCLPLLGILIIGPLVVYLLKGKESPFLEMHSREALNFQISMTIYFALAGLGFFILVGIPLAVALGLFQTVVVILATVKASSGEAYHYPLSIEFVK